MSEKQPAPPRHRAAHQALADSAFFDLLTRRAVAPQPSPWVPMAVPDETLRNLSGEEWLLHAKLQAQQATDFPEYAEGWNRPTPAAARATWDLLSGADALGLKLSSLSSNPWPSSWGATLEEQARLDTTLMQAFAVVMATAVNAGRARVSLTQNLVLTALCRAFSDHFRAAVDEGRATTVFHLTEETWAKCRRDLVRHRLNLRALWELLSVHSLEGGSNPLFALSWITQDDEAATSSGGYQVKLRESADYGKPFKRLIDGDRYNPAPHYINPLGRYPILRAFNKPNSHAARRERSELVAETAFNTVMIGSETARTLAMLERSAVLLHVRTFQQDYLNAKQDMAACWRELRDLGLRCGVLSRHERKLRGRVAGTFRKRAIRDALKKGRLRKSEQHRVSELLTRYDDSEWIVTSFRNAYEQIGTAAAKWAPTGILEGLEKLTTPKEYWVIRSSFYKTVNRRYQPENFHLSAITTETWSPEALGLVNALEEPGDLETGLRFRWFKARPLPSSPEEAQELVGYDATASQVQIIALLAGLTNLEASFKNGGDFRRDLAAAALPHMRPGYSGIEDARLVAALKNAVMTRFYGRKIHKVVQEHWNDKHTFGPGWRSGIQQDERKSIKQEAERLFSEWFERVRGLILVAGGNTAVIANLTERLTEPNLRRMKRKAIRRAVYKAATRYAARRADEVLDTMPDREGVEKFLLACRRMALLAHKKERGVTLTDPLDASDPDTGGRFTWNPIAYQADTDCARNGGIGPTIGKLLTGKSAVASERAKLQNLLSPCWVHCLDSYALSLVIHELAKRQIHTFSTVHDCVYVPERIPVEEGESIDGLSLLKDAMDAAAWSWFKGLGPAFDDLERYLGTDDTKIRKPKGWRLPWTSETYGDYARRLRPIWESRVDEAEHSEARRPAFAVKPSRKHTANSRVIEEA